jgi:hypothetical protein
MYWIDVVPGKLKVKGPDGNFVVTGPSSNVLEQYVGTNYSNLYAGYYNPYAAYYNPYAWNGIGLIGLNPFAFVGNGTTTTVTGSPGTVTNGFGQPVSLGMNGTFAGANGTFAGVTDSSGMPVRAFSRSPNGNFTGFNSGSGWPLRRFGSYSGPVGGTYSGFNDGSGWPVRQAATPARR